jgi:YD repeat-containing protein
MLVPFIASVLKFFSQIQLLHGLCQFPYGYANPDAVTQIANGLSTTTFTYDNNGNVTQKTVDGTTTTYVYDYDSPPRSSRTGPRG